MFSLTHTHMAVALLVTPILAVLAWFAVDAIVAEQALPAQAGQSYPLVAKSNCRYASGSCELHNDEFSIVVTMPADGYLRVTSRHALDDILLAVGDPSANSIPQRMQQSDETGLYWVLKAGEQVSDVDRLLIVARRGDVTFFGEASTAFALP